MANICLLIYLYIFKFIIDLTECPVTQLNRYSMKLTIATPKYLKRNEK